MLISVYRYIPEHDDSPRMQDYHLNLDPQQDLMVLDVLELLKEQDETLTYRRSCREGVCGSDGMNINGVNTLACITKISAFLRGGRLPSGQRVYPARGQADLVIRPLPGLPVIRDLEVDMNCVSFCPKKLNPRKAITDIEMLLLQKGV